MSTSTVTTLPATAPAPDDAAKSGSVHALQALNFCIADVQNGMGPYMALFLQANAGWNPAQIGSVLAASSLAQVVAQTPAGVLIDRLHQKRTLLAGGVGLVAAACLSIILFTTWPVVISAQAAIGVAGAIFPPCLAAVALGLVGRKRLDQQQGTNQAFNAAGNVFAALALGACGYYLGLHWMFCLIGVLCVGACYCIWRIRPNDIDYNLARGADKGPADPSTPPPPAGFLAGLQDVVAGFKEVFKQRPMLVFVGAAVLFHFANAAMVPLVTQMLGKGRGAQQAVLYTSGYMVASQLVFMGVAVLSGSLAQRFGRKPLFLFGFAALAVRGVLYTLSSAPMALIAVQCLDGLGAGIFGVVGVLIVADLTQGTGRFNAAQGAIAAAQGTGAFLSNAIAGALAKSQGTTVALLSLAGVAAAGLVFFWLFMPETQGWTKRQATAPSATT